jgi:hypothetical protein
MHLIRVHCLATILPSLLSLTTGYLHFVSERYDHPHRDVVSINEISPIILSLLLYKINLSWFVILQDINLIQLEISII